MSSLCLANVFIALLAIQLSLHPAQGQRSECSTQPCLDAAQSIKSMMNTSADPCQNPSVYFCGNWMNEFRLPADESSWSSSFTGVGNQTREALRQLLENRKCPADAGSEHTWDDMLSCYYDSCTNVERMDRLRGSPLIKVMEEKAPFLLQRIKDPQSIDREGLELSNQEKVKVLSERLSVLIDGLEGRYVLYLSEGGLSLPYRQYEQSDAVETYLEFITNLLFVFTSEVQGSISDSHDLRREMESRASDVVEMEQNIKNISLTPEQDRDAKLTTNLRSWKAVQADLTESLDLQLILAPLIAMAGNSATEEDKSQFIVDNPLFFPKLSSLIKSKWSWGVIHDYLLARTLRSFAGGLSKEYRHLVDVFETKMLGSTPPPQWRRCLVSATGDLGWVLSLRYVHSIPMPTRRKEISEEMVKSLMHTYRDVIQNVQWMDAETKKIALHKLGAVTYKLGYPDWLLTDHDTYFIKYYGSPDLAPMRDFIEASIHLSRQMTEFRMSRLGEQKDETEWGMLPQDVNAYFNPIQNEIVFPLSIMREPFLRVWTECKAGQIDCSSPEEAAFMQILTYGALGAVIGHELTHGFDDQGRHFGEKGQLEEWWTPKSAAAFNEAAKCISEQYGHYAVKLHRPSSDGSGRWVLQNVSLSGQLTLGENIADNGGIKLAYLALQRLHPEYFTTQIVPRSLSEIGITSSGLFTASFSQVWCSVSRERVLIKRVSNNPHSPAPLRIIGTLTNFETYADAFECLPGTKVNPSSISHSDSHIMLHRSMQEDERHIEGQEASTIIFDGLNGVVAPVMPNRCQVW